MTPLKLSMATQLLPTTRTPSQTQLPRLLQRPLLQPTQLQRLRTMQHLRPTPPSFLLLDLWQGSQGSSRGRGRGIPQGAVEGAKF